MKALFEAVSKKDYSTVQKLLTSGTNVNAKDSIGWTPLYYAFLKKDPVMIQLLRRNGAYLDVLNAAGSSMLSSVCMMGDISAARLMIKNGVDVNLPNHDGRVPLHFAVIRDHFDNNLSLVPTLLKRGAQPDKTGINGFSPLHYAVSCGNVPAAKELLAFGANPQMSNNELETPLFLAFKTDNREMIILLLTHDAKLHTRNHRGLTPLDYSTEQTRELLSALEKQLPDLQNRLMEEISSEKPDKFIINLLIDKITRGGKLPQNMLFTREDDLGVQVTPLQAAVLNTTDKSILKSIVDANPKLLDVADPEYGWTALHLSAMHQKPETVRWLILTGADFTLRDKNPRKNASFDDYIRDNHVRRDILELCRKKQSKWKTIFSGIDPLISEFNHVIFQPMLPMAEIYRSPFSRSRDYRLLL